MYAPQFVRNLNDILDEIKKSSFYEEVQKCNFLHAELAQIHIEVLKIAMQSALSISELELKNKELSLSLTRAKLEAESNLVLNKINLINAMATNLKSLVECFVLKQSVFDNAYINRANLLVNIANITANGNDIVGAKEALKIASEYAQKIGEQANTSFDPILEDLKQRAEATFAYGSGAKDAILVTNKYILEPNEEAHLIGISIFGHNESKFKRGSEILGSGGEINFSSKEVGEHTITFSVKDNAGKEVSDSITLFVKEQTKA
ncbi:hypothetical protein CQA49_08055 [Helicobacter sp. MIT 00-7814]|uniref:hypothetical protein n=1 Tax=unclassified Helicobacter TaxID=2593540 RepID=UPI000E1F191E|nr:MULTISPECIES: hypothetical protein [unclassified Helicobacter]RDU51879.1 hypothetical protein CQA37_09205 [Helicobacter sp. MIT 99-10781]RDU52558.1 hypothetical protein CQA49_08055 [Helicobacter sp. MIT 00-7814]